MKVEQFLNRNQFHLYGDYKHILQSYKSKVVEITNNPGCVQVIQLGRDWDYSTTTSKHVYAFLDEYSKVRICEVVNKRKYIKNLLEECKKDKTEFYQKHNYTIFYDEEMV